MAVGYNLANFGNFMKQSDNNTEIWDACVGHVVTIMANTMMFVNAIQGIWSLVSTNQDLLVYAGFILLTLILQAYSTYYDKAMDITRPARHMNQSFYQNVKDLGLVQQRWFWDGIQSKQECCGLNSPDDYLSMNKSIPVSCCPNAYARSDEQARKLLYNDCIQTAAYYKNGCMREVLQRQELELSSLIMVTGLFMGIQIIGLFLALWMARTHRGLKVVKVPATK